MEQKSTSRYILTALSIIVVVTALALIALNAFDLENRLGWNMWRINSGNQALADKYKEGYLNARATYQKMCPLVNRQGSTITGRVEEVGKNSIVITQDYFDTDAQIDNVSNMRTVEITKNTDLTLNTAKPIDQLNKETATFKPGSGNPPSAFSVKEIGLSEIKLGDYVSIESDKDLRTVASFTALKLKVIR
ncbi:MAG: hypothetical protein WC641_07870 [Patescibacteria group bacterium]